MRSSTQTIIAALRNLASTIESGDGVANAAIAEAADRLEILQLTILKAESLCKEHESKASRSRRLYEEGDSSESDLWYSEGLLHGVIKVVDLFKCSGDNI
jgi:hypothetical protein